MILIMTIAAVSAAEDTAPQRHHPPPEAIAACDGKKEGDECGFVSPHGQLQGTCMSGAENISACRPNHPPPAPPPYPEAKGSVTQGIVPTVDNLTHLIAACLAAAVVAAALTWYGFFRYCTMPLRTLRRVTQQLAQGNLSARVGEGLVNRQNEVAQLGRDVDRMAIRIETLVGAHQRLIRDVSHELRSPLSRLNVALELARQSAGPALSAPFDRIERESNRLNDLISQLLMLTRLENDNGMIQRVPLDIAALIREIAADADFEAKGSGRQVLVTTIESPIVLNGNRELLRQALENLLRNAVRYTKEATAVEISLRKKESVSRLWARIEISDHGPGVAEHELKDIFRPFYRVNEAHERQSGGAGVGLAIAERAVLLHGGRLQAINAPGAGLIMKMDIPLA
ncbi:MAG: HAMP domain-containing protein [Nitrospirae bacterium]|nr:HAMP domain-containing protein [Nitrospirota bacterium]